jgi:hypothetical protein
VRWWLQAAPDDSRNAGVALGTNGDMNGLDAPALVRGATSPAMIIGAQRVLEAGVEPPGGPAGPLPCAGVGAVLRPKCAKEDPPGARLSTGGDGTMSASFSDRWRHHALRVDLLRSPP